MTVFDRRDVRPAFSDDRRSFRDRHDRASITDGSSQPARSGSRRGRAAMISLLVVNYRSAALAARGDPHRARADLADRCRSSSSTTVATPRRRRRLRDVADTLIVSDTQSRLRGRHQRRTAARVTGDDARRVESRRHVRGRAPSIDRATPARSRRRRAGVVLGRGASMDVAARRTQHRAAEDRSRSWPAARAHGATQRDRRRFRQARRVLVVGQTTRVRMLSGAVMAIRADAFDDVGGFDERFALYFEEIRLSASHAERRAHRLRSVGALPPSLQPERGADRAGCRGAVRAVGAAVPGEVERPVRRARAETAGAPVMLASRRRCCGPVVIESERSRRRSVAAGELRDGRRAFPGNARTVDDRRTISGSVRGDVLYLRAVERQTRDSVLRSWTK